MQHLDDGIIHELIDGEIPSLDLPPIQAHLAACEACRSRLEAAREATAEADELLVMLDAVEPATPATAPLVFPTRRPHWSRQIALAASLMLAVGLGYVGRHTIDSMVGVPGESARVTIDTTAAPVVPREMPDAALPTATAQDGRPVEQRATSPDPRPDVVDPPRTTATDPTVPAQPRAEPVLRDQDATPPPSAMAGAAAPVELGRQRAAAAPENERVRRDNSFEDAAIATGALREGAPTRGFTALESRDAAKSMVAAREVDLPTAMRILGGSIKLIDGLVPHRLDAAGDEVMVVYQVFWGELLLSQRRDGDRLEWHLTAPPGFPADSLAALRGKVRP